MWEVQRRQLLARRQQLIADGGGTQPAIVAAMATRANVPYGFNGALGGIMSRTAHFARDAATQIKVVYCNFYVDTVNNTNTYAELGTGSSAAFKVGFETAGGAFSPFLFSASASGSIASGSLLVSDFLSVSLAAGDKFYLRPSFVNTGGCIYNAAKADATLGDRFEFSSNDKTTSGTINNDLPGYAYFPVAVIGLTKKRSAFLLGTSRTFGFNDTADGVTGDIGIMARSIGPLGGYCNAGVASDSIQRVVANPTKRLNIANTYYTDTIIEHGINDVTAGRTLVQVQGDFATLLAALTTRNRLVTNAPNTSGAWTAPDGSDQTNTAGTNITALNAWLLTLPNGVVSCADIASVVALVGTPTKWKAPGYTDDGLHGLQLAYQAVQSSGLLTI